MSFNINLRLPSSSPSHPKVPNEPPTATAPYKLALIGEAPANLEVEAGRPFVGPAGHLLSQVMVGTGLLRSACYMGNITPYQPPNNHFSAFKWQGPEIQEGLHTLATDLQNWKPNLILLLGQNPLAAAGIDPKTTKISTIRGSLFRCTDGNSPFFSFKCLPTFHPSYINQSGYSDKPLFIADLRRAREEAEFPALDLPKYEFNLRPTANWICSKLQTLLLNTTPIAIDIEGAHPAISCISICDTPRTGFIIPFNELSPLDMVRVVRELARLLQTPTIPKILQNGLYDASNLALSFNILVNPIADDTMLSGWEIKPELRKSLGLLASLYTRQPYYKDDRKKEDRDTFFNYCCTDSAVTYEIRNVHRSLLSKADGARSHYDFNLACLRPLLYCQIRGINYDVTRADEIRKEYLVKMSEVQQRINARAAEYDMDSVNIGSPKQLCTLLYDRIGLPTQHPKIGPRIDTSRRTTDEEACLTLFKKFDDSIVTDILTWRSFDKRRQYCEIKHDKDNRIRSSYNLVGTVTGRVSSSKTISGTGYNLQTIPKKLRCLFRADADHHFFQCDLSGADGWTVAAYSASLGDPTMLEDYRYVIDGERIKPAKVIALMYHHGAEVNTWPREKIWEECQKINEEGEGWWLYFACKRVQHATSYDAKAARIAETILHDAYKKEGKLITIPIDKCKQLQDLYERVRYRGVMAFKNFIRNQLNTQQGYPTLTDSTGHSREFFGRPRDNDTFRQALSHLPQTYTTYATNLAILNLWRDPENRRSDGSLRIEPLHQVHDAVCGQFRKEDTTWALPRLQHYFDNPLEIAGLEITIPFDGAYGPSWGELGPSYGGGVI
jgi:uracil-DNA glycosylase family 4